MEAYGRNGPLATPNPPTTLPAFALPRRKNYLRGTDLDLSLPVPTPSPRFSPLALPRTEKKLGKPIWTCAYPRAPSFRPSLGRKILLAPLSEILNTPLGNTTGLQTHR
jgi:hypothetical protein